MFRGATVEPCQKRRLSIAVRTDPIFQARHEDLIAFVDHLVPDRDFFPVRQMTDARGREFWRRNELVLHAPILPREVGEKQAGAG